MRRNRFFAIVAVALAAVFVCACGGVTPGKADYEITLNDGLPYVLTVGETVDFTQYFTVTDKNGNRVVVTADMLDLSGADTSVPGLFWVTLSIGGVSKTAAFTVVAAGDSSSTGGSAPSGPTGGDEPTAGNFAEVAARYADMSKWNFKVDYTEIYEGETYDDHYEYYGYNALNTYLADDGNYYTDYISYDPDEGYVYYADNGDGTYSAYDEYSDEFADLMAYSRIIDLTVLGEYSFTLQNGKYIATAPSAAGNALLGEYDGVWQKLEITVADGVITGIFAEMDDGYVQQYELYGYGTVAFTLPSSGQGTNPDPEPTGKMGKQVYDPATFDGSTIAQKTQQLGYATGLPEQGSVRALVIPVQFEGDTVTSTQLANLNAAFNGNSGETGWESVKSYYYKASYGKLELSFDIQPLYKAQNSAAYYENYSKRTSAGEVYGDEALLLEALSYYEKTLDLSVYDTDGDTFIDAVYLIYSAPVDYDAADFYWAYTTWYLGDNAYDGTTPYYYLFAGFDFMDEGTPRDTATGTSIAGLSVNASTYIHETGHLLGLDDYYDYDTERGSGDGLGGADMMDATVGDQNVYSKTMLGWLEPTVVNQTETVTIKSSQAEASALLIPLDFNNSYFCEYLMIDLYSAEGVNALHAGAADSILYGGAAYGVRIYHVCGYAKNPFDNDYGSLTDNNNSDTADALIRLVEADGDRRFSRTDGWAARSDLWQRGSTLRGVFPSYSRSDGKLINFDVEIVSVSSSSATITVTFD